MLAQCISPKLLEILKELEDQKYQGPVTLHLAAGVLRIIEYKKIEKVEIN